MLPIRMSSRYYCALIHTTPPQRPTLPLRSPIVHGGERWSQAPGRHQLAASTLFADRLEPDEAELARELARDPYVFDFLG